MQIDLQDVGPQGLELDRAVEVPRLEDASGEPITVSGASVHGTLVRTGRGFECRGRMRATARLGCSRCLEPFDLALDEAFHLTLVEAMEEPAEDESEVTEESAALLAVPGGKLDLTAVAVEQIYLALPQKPVCRRGCKGLCPRCGTNRNVSECGCESQDVDPRLAPLLKWKGRRT